MMKSLYLKVDVLARLDVVLNQVSIHCNARTMFEKGKHTYMKQERTTKKICSSIAPLASHPHMILKLGATPPRQLLDCARVGDQKGRPEPKSLPLHRFHRWRRFIITFLVMITVLQARTRYISPGDRSLRYYLCTVIALNAW
jgi:hypothetical protein